MKLRITPDGLPIYQQIINQVKYLVASGRLIPGDELPAIRVLAEQLLVNPNTVAKAYRELESQGVVESRHGSGTYISDEGSPLKKKELLKALQERADTLLAEGLQMGMELEEILELVRQRHENMQISKNKKGDR
jgi:GntR family transcriptional regulator